MTRPGEPCPIYRPSKKDFERPFCDYIRDIFAKNPDVPMFKVMSRLLPPPSRLLPTHHAHSLPTGDPAQGMVPSVPALSGPGAPCDP